MKTSKALADTEDMLDAFYLSDYKSPPPKYLKYLNDNQVPVTEARIILAYYRDLANEVVEFHENYTTRQHKSYIAFLGVILNDTAKYLHRPRKPRRVKSKPPEAIARKVIYLPKYDDADGTIESIAPAQIIGAKELWLYNIVTRKLRYLTSEEGLSVKGTTVIGFDETKSQAKTIREGTKTIISLLNMGRVTMLSKYVALKTKPSVPNGRINRDTLILKANK